MSIGTGYGQCDSQDFTVGNFYLGDADGNPINTSCEPGTTQTAYIYSSFTRNTATDRFTLSIAFNIILNDDPSTTTSYSSCHYEQVAIPTYVDIQLTPITYTCGDKIQATDVFVSWEANDKDPCDSNNGFGKCYSNPPGFEVDGPLIPNFNFENPCNSYNINFTDLTRGGENDVAYLYSWDFGDGNTSTQASPSHTYAGAGDYNVTLTVTDADGRVESQTFTVTVYEIVSATIDKTDILCSGDTDGSLIVNASGGDGNYTYEWSGPNGFTSTSQNISGLGEGNYTVTVTDGRGCAAERSSSIIVLDTEAPTITAPSGYSIEGCSATDVINGTTSLAYSEVEIFINETQFTAEGGSFIESNVASISYQDSSTGTCPIVVTRTYTITDQCGEIATDTQVVTINIPNFTITDIDGATTVNCITDATETFTLPTVTDACGNTLSPSAATIIDDPDSLTCEGTRTFTYTYQDCNGNTDTWNFVYTIDLPDFTTPANGSSTVECLADAQVQPTTPTIQDACGNIISAILVTTPSAIGCEGEMVWVFNYQDCAGNSHDWTYTYTIDIPALTAITPTSATVECYDDIVLPAPPTINDACGTPITPSGPVESAVPECEGDVTYTWTYTDCAGSSQEYVHTVTIAITTAPVVPANDSATVDCLADAVQPNAPVVNDVCGTPITPVITQNTDPV
ncbi:HYR-like domain-containing protein, partial [Zhouia amylolytica]